MGAAAPTPTTWHALPPNEVLTRLGSRSAGLTSSEAGRRRAEVGPNALDVARPHPWWRVLGHQFASVVVALLVVAAGLALVLGERLESAAIAAVLFINVVVGFWTEWRARTAVESLRRLQVAEAVVRRGGQLERVSATEIVPGDILVLGEGDAVAADARLIEAHELSLDEAALTGESLPVRKSVEPVSDADSAHVGLADQTSMVFKGTMVAGGEGCAVVSETGASTQIGRIGVLVGSLEQAPTPIERRLALLGRRLVWITLGIAVLVIGVGLLGGRELWLVVETGLALAIAAVPEGLPVVATVTLAVGMWRMAQRAALVRRPPAVEALGSATVICSDKTGTLTTGRMTATTIVVGGTRLEVAGAGMERTGAVTRDGELVDVGEVPGLAEIVKAGVLANAAGLPPAGDDREAIGDPTDKALLVLGAKLGSGRADLLEREPEVGRLPFSSRRMFMATFHGSEGGPSVRVKGAADRVLGLCTSRLVREGVEPLTEGGRSDLTAIDRNMAEEGLRVLALAVGHCDEEEVGDEAALRDLTFLGFIGLMDPPASQVAETIARFQAAGVRTVMITGDQPATARSVAMRLGMIEPGGRVLSGRDLAEMDAELLAQEVGRISVYGRVSPEDKVRIVEALQANGEVVGMLGDGVNDAPALKRADIGVAMGLRGTDVAKDVADLVLADDRLETVAVAVEEGRVIFDNIRKFIFYLFSCNVSEVGIVFVASVAALPLPLLPLQLLWLNVVTDVFPALALSVESAEPGVMDRPPRPQEAAILSRGFLVQLMVFSSLITASTFAAFAWGLWGRRIGVEHAVTLSFATLAFAQLLHVFNARTLGPIRPSGFFRNRWLWGALALSITLQLFALYHPGLSLLLRTVPLDVLDWTVVLAAASAPLLFGQLWKVFLARRTDARA